MEATVSKCEDNTNDEEDIVQRQKKEKKELQSKITSMKHSVAKTDKKGKREMTAEIVKLEAELEKRHETELDEFRRLKDRDENGVENDLNGEITQNGTSEEENQTRRVTRAQKRRDKKEGYAKKREKFIEEGTEESKTSQRQMEKRFFKPILAQKGLKLVEISADGDCLYNAIAHQLILNGLDFGGQELRSLTASTIRNNKTDFLPFLLDGNDDDVISDDQFEAYCNKIVKTTVWGGQPELKALAIGLQRRIEVLQANGAPITIGEEISTTENPLVITYHRHAYRLGEHYNSTEPKSLSNESSSDSD